MGGKATVVVLHLFPTRHRQAPLAAQETLAQPVPRQAGNRPLRKEPDHQVPQALPLRVGVHSRPSELATMGHQDSSLILIQIRNHNHSPRDRSLSQHRSNLE